MRGKEEEYDFGNCSQYTEAKLSFVSMVLLARKTYVLNVVQVYGKHKLHKVAGDGRQRRRTRREFQVGSWNLRSVSAHVF